MSNTIDDYTAANSIDPINDYYLIEQSATYKKINRNTSLGITGAPIGDTDTQSLSNKTIGNTNSLTIKDGSLTIQNSSSTTKQAVFSASGITAGQTRTFTFPDASGTLVTAAGTQTLTNKTLTSPTISGGSIDNATVTVDSISGHTTGTVVTVANLQISNGVLNSNNSVVTANVTDGAITPAKLQSGTGSGWSWQSFTPVWTNLTLGNATQSAAYIQTGKTVQGYVLVTLGNTSSVGSSPQFNVPVAANSFYNNGSVNYILDTGWGSAGGGSYVMLSYFPGLNTAIRLGYSSAGVLAAASATAPGTWATGNFIYIQFKYQAA